MNNNIQNYSNFTVHNLIKPDLVIKDNLNNKEIQHFEEKIEVFTNLLQNKLELKTCDTKSINLLNFKESAFEIIDVKTSNSEFIVGGNGKKLIRYSLGDLKLKEKLIYSIDNNVTSLVNLETDNELFYCGTFCTIYLFHIDKIDCINKIDLNIQYFVWSLHLYNNILAAGLGNGDLFLIKYEKDTIIRKESFKIHKNTINSFISFENTLLSGSYDSKIISSTFGEIKDEFIEHKAKVSNLMKISSNKFLSCSFDFTILVCNFDENNKITKIISFNTNDYNCSLKLIKSDLFTCGCENSLRILHLNFEKNIIEEIRKIDTTNKFYKYIQIKEGELLKQIISVSGSQKTIDMIVFKKK